MYLKTYFLIAVISLLPAFRVMANDYRVCVESIESQSMPDETNEAKESVACSIEVVTRPGENFRTKVKVSGTTLDLRGSMKPNEKGGFVVQIQLTSKTVIGETNSVASDVRQETLKWAVSTTVVVTEGMPVTIGGMGTVVEELGKAAVKTNTRVVLTVKKIEDDVQEN